MACNYDVTTDRGKVRLLINDTASPVGCNFPDDEIDAFLAMAGDSILTAAAFALEAWAASLLGDYTSEKIGDYSYSKKEAAGKTALALEYKRQEAESPYFTWAEPDLTGENEEDD